MEISPLRAMRSGRNDNSVTSREFGRSTLAIMEENTRIIDGDVQGDDVRIDRALRPRRLAEYIGQDGVREQMDIFVAAARQRSEALDHVLVFGPPGLGKTTLAHVIANEMEVGFRQTSGPVLERPGDLAALLTNLEENDVQIGRASCREVGEGGVGEWS